MSDTQTQDRNRRRVLQGVVTSDKMDKSITVLVERRFAHPKYGKFVRSHKKYHAHDEQNEAHVGDTVEVAATRPLSKTKRWRLVRIIDSPLIRTGPTSAETGAEAMTAEADGGDA